MTPALALWLGYAGVCAWRSADARGKWKGLGMLAAAAAAVFLVGLHFFFLLQMETPPGTPLGSNPLPGLRVSLEFLSVAAGSWAAMKWWPYLAIGLLALFVTSLAALLWVWWERPAERFRAIGLFLFLVAVSALALGLGHSRAYIGAGAGFAPRYVTLALPALCAVYLCWVLWRGPGSQLVQGSLAVLMCVSIWPNTSNVLAIAKDWHGRASTFEEDLKAGLPSSVLAFRHLDRFNGDPNYGGRFVRYLNDLHRAGIGLFRQMVEDPPWQEIPLPLTPMELHEITREDGVGRCTGEDPWLVFALEKPQQVTALRIDITYLHCEAPEGKTFRTWWKKDQENEYTDSERHYNTSFGVPDPSVIGITIWVNDTIDRIRIQPDTNQSVFQLTGVTLLLPPAASPPSRPPLPGRRPPTWFMQPAAGFSSGTTPAAPTSATAGPTQTGAPAGPAPRQRSASARGPTRCGDSG
jgi:hypothetical protein